MAISNGNFGDYGGDLYKATGAMVDFAETRKAELSEGYEKKLDQKKDLTELSRLLSQKIEKDGEVQFKEPQKLRDHIVKVKTSTDIDLEDWNEFLEGKTDSVASWILKVINSSADFHKKSIALDLEKSALHLQDLAQKEKLVYDGLARILSDLSQTRRAFLTVGRGR